MKHIKSINEFYHRTAGFRYSEPSLKYSISGYYIGQISEEELVSTLKDSNVTFDSVEVESNPGDIKIQTESGDRDVKVDGHVSFDVSVYVEREIDSILDNLSKTLYVNYRVKLIDVAANEHGKK